DVEPAVAVEVAGQLVVKAGRLVPHAVGREGQRRRGAGAAVGAQIPLAPGRPPDHVGAGGQPADVDVVAAGAAEGQRPRAGVEVRPRGGEGAGAGDIAGAVHGDAVADVGAGAAELLDPVEVARRVELPHEG